MGWVSPTGFVDPATKWSDEAKAYDDNTATYAVTDANVAGNTWSDFLEFTHAALDCDSVRAFQNWTVNYFIDLDVYDGNWHDITEEAFPLNDWHEIALGATYTLTKIRIRTKYSSALKHAIYEVDFGEVDYGAKEHIMEELVK